jgi:hypothetical protein
MFNMLVEQEDGEDTNTANNVTTVMQTAAFTTDSTLSNTYLGATTVPSEITTAINQLAANQVAIQQQMATMVFAAPPPPPLTRSFTFPLSRTWGSNLSWERPRACSTWARWWRPSAWRTWKRLHRQSWRRAQMQSIHKPNAWSKWRYPPICRWPPRGICAPNRSKGECKNSNQT